MEQTGLHPVLEVRLAGLAATIAELRRDMRWAHGLERISIRHNIKDLVRRYRGLEESLRRLNGKGPGFRQNVTAEIEAVADDAVGWLRECVMRVDSHYRAY